MYCVYAVCVAVAVAAAAIVFVVVVVVVVISLVVFICNTYSECAECLMGDNVCVMPNTKFTEQNYRDILYVFVVPLYHAPLIPLPS